MIEIIKEHLAKYPQMTIRDALKLLYQSEFGGGHFVQDEQKSLARIEDEYNDRKNTPQKEPLLWEPIGGGMCRIYLEALCQGLAAPTLNKIFVLSANVKRGSMEGLERKLDEFSKMCEETVCFPVERVIQEIQVWREQGYPAISHSEIYREAYMPAYRVAELKYGKLLEVFIKIDRLCQSSTDKETFVVAIDGMCGSGKSTLGEMLKQVYDCNLFHMDDFFLQPHQRTPERLCSPGGNVDYERFQEEILAHLQDKGGFSYGIFDCSRQQITEKVQVPYKRLNLIEGAYCQHPYFKEPYDLQFFLELSEQEQIKRLAKRNGERMFQRFINEWIPMENAYFEAFDIKKQSICISTE